MNKFLQNLKLGLSRFLPTRSAKIWAALLLLCLLGQIVIVVCGGAEWRDAVKKRTEWSESRLEVSGEKFDTEQDRETRIFNSIKDSEFLHTYTWYVAAGGIGVIALLILTIPFWCRQVAATAAVSTPPRRFLLALLVIVLIGCAVRIPRMDQSLYNDESFNFTRYIHGQFKPDRKTGETRFHPNSWERTFWGNHFANNGVFYSVLARASHDLWQKMSGAVDGEVSEVALRIPVLLGGLAGIAMIGLGGYVCFGTRAGLISAGLTALHPWHLRYSTEARCYGIMIFFAAAMLVTAILAIRTGRWRWWVLFLLAEALCLWTYLGALYFLVAANLILAVWLFIKHRPQIPRWLVANIFAGILYLQIAAPTLPQAIHATKVSTTFKGEVTHQKITDVTSYLVSGMPFYDEVPENHWNPAWGKFGETSGKIIFAILIICGVIALFRVVRTRGDGTFVAVVAILAPVMGMLISDATGAVVHNWYIIYALPALLITFGSGIALFWEKNRLIGGLIAGLFVASYAFPLIAYDKQAKEQLRPVMEYMRGGVYPFDDKTGFPLVAAFWSDTVYDPTIIYTPTVPDLEAAIERSKAEKRPLYVEFGYRGRALVHSRPVVDFVEKSGKFKFLKTFHGLEQSQFSHHVYQLID